MPLIPREPLKLDDLEYRRGGEDGRQVEATETREFTVFSRPYRLLLSDENAKRFDATFAEWVEFAERVLPDESSANPPRRAYRAPLSRELTTEIRRWAETQDAYPFLAPRGRLPGKVVKDFFRQYPDRRPG